ncbi:hypothetical protein [Limosilactobacillus fermentum]|uniref:hypothetical protein n=1 Tax=Limosilactobacillus fermentum TaxID=1613 RepID=UPI0021A92F46|nr:hypothetical protein [Limosilactobacillus fermentum]MCT2870998.1 hypothetical protein [Limosilactobacillus fermentum]
MVRWDLILSLLGAVFGGGMSALFAWLQNRTTSDVNRHEVIYSSTDSLSDNLRQTLDRLNEVMNENFRLKNQIIELQKSVDDLTYQVEQLSKK